MSHDALADMVQLTDALFQAEQVQMRDLFNRETQLRRDLAELESYHRDNRILPTAELAAVRQVGADVLWQGWVSRTRQELQRQLALLLAEKGNRMRALRRAHGRYLAAEELHRADNATQDLYATKRMNQLEQSLILLTTASDRNCGTS